MKIKKVTTMKKDSIYRLKNNEKMPWRALLLVITKQFQRLVNPTNEVSDKSTFILDDTTHAKTGRRMEQLTKVFDHVAGKKGNKLGNCPSRDFDAQIAHISTCYILYTLLAYFRRVNDYESLDGLFAEIKDDLIEKNVAERLWDSFEELLQVYDRCLKTHIRHP